MNKVVLLLLVGIVGLGLVSLHLVGKLRDERARNVLLSTTLERFGIPAPQVKGEHQVLAREVRGLYRVNRAEVLAEERGDVPPAGFPTGLPSGFIGATIVEE
jgi:hypothetical protein